MHLLVCGSLIFTEITLNKSYMTSHVTLRCRGDSESYLKYIHFGTKIDLFRFILRCTNLVHEASKFHQFLQFNLQYNLTLFFTSFSKSFRKIYV